MFKDKLKKRDVESIIKFSIVWPVAILMKPFICDVWLVSERPAEAQDNGYWLFKYICENECHRNTYYIIKSGARDEKKVVTLGKTIKAYSLKHYLYYLLATKHISSQIDGGMPSMRVCSFLERHGLLKNKKIFLQHGVIKDVLPFCFKETARVDMFCCSTKIETEFVRKNFGYQENEVFQTGLARFDNLYKNQGKTKKQVLVMPTWRAWLAKKEFKNDETAIANFINSPFYKCYATLLENKRLHDILKKNGYNLIFYVHSDLQFYTKQFQILDRTIEIASDQDYDVQQLLVESEILVTDYSSIFFDFAFMKKPICYYHFDYEEYRKKQHLEGYYDYHKGLGPVFDCVDDIVMYIEHIISQEGKMDQVYSELADDLMDLRDGNNCERIIKQINIL